ncbi:hypothetical protein ElyMa_002207200 [Elysia marginata]|uniref:Uncharacterized protein n=1 Tax=Elysia marginata TaxID=1093978 RepID=A0AAV4FV63_9GAST|nr:hypothetical protein ElyMa_002207200 [Elysia marginata]
MGAEASMSKVRIIPRAVVAKLKLKQEFKNIDPSNYAQIEASKRAPTRRGGKEKMVVTLSKDDNKPDDNEDGKTVDTFVSDSGVVSPGGQVAGSRAGTAAPLINGAVVIPAAAAALATQGSRAGTVPGTRAGVGSRHAGEGAGGGEGGRWNTEGGGNGGGGGGSGLGGPQVAAIAGGAAVVGAVTGAAAAKLLSNNNNSNRNGNKRNMVNTNLNNNKRGSYDPDTKKYDEEDLRLNLYTEKEMTPIPEVVTTSLGGTTIFNVQPNNIRNNSNNNSNAFDSDREDQGPKKGRKPKKPVAKLLQPIDNPASDFDDYRSQSDPPPKPASYAVPTPVREMDKHVIREELQARQAWKGDQGNIRSRQPHGLRF